MIIFLSVTAAVIVLLLCVLYGVYRFTFYSPDKNQNDDGYVPENPDGKSYRNEILENMEALNSIGYSTVTIMSDDGKKLFGRYYEVSPEAPVAVCMHGYRGTPSRDFCVAARLLMKHGFNVLLAEQRAHVRSGGHTITFGIKERYDCLGWIKYILRTNGNATRIVLVGISMGAATVLMSSGLDLPENVIGVMADCPYSSPKGIIYDIVEKMRVPTAPGKAAVSLAAVIFAHIRLGSADAAEAVRKASLPILIVHGESDSFVPCSMSREIYDAAPDHITYETFPGADHGVSYFSDPERYTRLFCDYLDSIYKKA